MFPAPIGQEAGKADTDESARQDMQQEAAQELFGSHSHFAVLATVGIVLVEEGDLAVGDGYEPMVGDGDAMCVACQVVEYMLRPAEGAFAVDYPILTKERPQEGMEGFLFGQWLEAAGKYEFALTKGTLQTGDNLAAKDAAQYLYRQEERVARVDPMLVVECQTTRWDHTMNVRMMAPTLTIP